MSSELILHGKIDAPTTVLAAPARGRFITRLKGHEPTWNSIPPLVFLKNTLLALKGSDIYGLRLQVNVCDVAIQMIGCLISVVSAQDVLTRIIGGRKTVSALDLRRAFARHAASIRLKRDASAALIVERRKTGDGYGAESYISEMACVPSAGKTRERLMVAGALPASRRLAYTWLRPKSKCSLIMVVVVRVAAKVIHTFSRLTTLTTTERRSDGKVGEINGCELENWAIQTRFKFSVTTAIALKRFTGEAFPVLISGVCKWP